MDHTLENGSEHWPPGTVRLEDIQRTNGKDIILQPRPTTDPNDPLNWPNWRKNWNFAICCFYALMVWALIDASTPTWGPMNEQLGFSYTILNDSYAVGSGSLALGAFLLIPFALKFGRRPIYIISTMVQFAVCIWSAKLETVADLILVNLFACGFGALAEVMVQMTVADVFFVHQRGLMNTLYVWIFSTGGSLAPVAAGYITTNQGWRWVWWWLTIFFGICLVLFFFTYEESKFIPAIHSNSGPEIVEGKAERSGSQDKGPQADYHPGNGEDGTPQDLNSISINHEIPVKTYWQKLAVTTTTKGDFIDFIRHGFQPLAILFTIPAVAYMALIYGVIGALINVMVTVMSSEMTLPPYNFNSSQIGLMSLPSFIGTTLGSLVVGPLSDWSVVRLSRRNNGIYEPEMRLWLMVPFVIFVPIGALMFGIGLNNGLSWPIIAVGYAINSFGVSPISSIALTYITDSYTDLVGDSLVAVTFVRNAIATIFIFCLTPWIDNVGIKNVIITITVLAAAVLICVVPFIFYGKKFRMQTRKRYQYFAERQVGGRR